MFYYKFYLLSQGKYFFVAHLGKYSKKNGRNKERGNNVLKEIDAKDQRVKRRRRCKNHVGR